MSIDEICSSWCETPLFCPNCDYGVPLYTDGRHRPQCVVCFYEATDEEIWECLIHS